MYAIMSNKQQSHRMSDTDSIQSVVDQSSSSSSTCTSTVSVTQIRSSIPSHSPMLLWIQSDRDSPAILITMIQMTDIVNIHVSCKYWKQYLDHPPRHLLDAVDLDFTCSLDSPHWTSIDHSLALGGALQQYVKTFATVPPKSTIVLPADTIHSLLTAASSFTNLTSLCLTLNFSQLSRASIVDISSLFERVGSSLEQLTLLNINGDETNPINPLPCSNVCVDIFDAIGQHLQQLLDIRIQLTRHDQKDISNEYVQKCHSLPFTFLQHLPHLTAFSFFVDFGVPLSYQQVQQIIQCKQIKRLNAGLWTGQHYPNRDQRRSRQQWIDEGIALLYRLPKLESISELIGEFNQDCIPHVLRISTLTDMMVDPLNDYSFLLQLKFLREISYHGTFFLDQSSNAMSRAQQWRNEGHCLSKLIDIITRIPTITELRVSSAIVLRDDLILLFQTHRLSSLSLLHVVLDPSNTFSFAQSLQVLRLTNCCDLNGNLIDWGLHLPILTNLPALFLTDRDYLGTSDSDFARRRMLLKIQMPLTTIKWHHYVAESKNCNITPSLR